MIQIEKHRALQQKVAEQFRPRFPLVTDPAFIQNVATLNRELSGSLPAQSFADTGSRNKSHLAKGMLGQIAFLPGSGQKVEVIANKRLTLSTLGRQPHGSITEALTNSQPTE
jgi:hypothetical protein